jgi:outer membrane immunogenic protein
VKKYVYVALATAALGLGSQAAMADPISTSFRGFRVEGDVGLDRFQSQGVHDNKLGYGGEAGFDGVIADRFVIGPEASFWRANNWTQNCTPGAIGGTVCNKSFEEWGAAVRAGVLVNPKLLIYGKGGYASNEQRKRFDAPPGETSFVDHYRTDGYQVGGGAEYSLTDMFYVNAEYKYSNYADHTSRQRAMLGFGLRLKP